MMKKRHRSTSPNTLDNTVNQGRNKGNATIDVSTNEFSQQNAKNKTTAKCREPPQELLERLAGGKKQKVLYFS